MSLSSLPLVRPPGWHVPLLRDQPQLSKQRYAHAMSAQLTVASVATAGGEVAVPVTELHGRRSSVPVVRPPSLHSEAPSFLDQPHTVPGIASGLQSAGHMISSQVCGVPETGIVGGTVGSAVVGGATGGAVLHGRLSSLPVVRPP